MAEPREDTPRLTDADRERFWAKVDRRGPDECWPWTRYLNADGYGVFGHGGRAAARTLLASRVCWFITRGVWPSVCVLHDCDNPRCCNPAHLFLGTPTDNNADMRRKGRQAKGDRHGSRVHPERVARGDRSGSRRHPEKLPRGEANPQARLNADAVRQIRGLRAGGMTQQAIAHCFGVSRAAIRKILKRLTWRHIP